MKILCIKSVIMRVSREIAFTKGKTYKAIVTDWGIEAINDDDEPHQLFCAGESWRADWDWFVAHFR